MKEKTIKFRDPVVERVVDKFVSRSDVGYDKYGKTLHDERTGGHKDLLGYLNDIQEELQEASSGSFNPGLPYYVTDVAG